MHRLFQRSLVLAGALLTLTAFTPSATAQSSAPMWGSPRSTASAASLADAPDTAAPRRRPTRRSTVRTDSVLTVSSRSSARSSSGAMSSERIAMISSSLREAGRPWIGTPYRWGGESRRGIDCSAFVRAFMRDNLGVDLPRATAGQQFEGVSVRKDDLLPGDLVFFRRRSVRHVGVYLGDGEFIHASSSRGVTVSNLSEGYYQDAYWMARRVLSAPSGRRPTPRRSATDSSSVRG
ncbi:MAG TPA: NlpC/P60 family protein [Rubricoccaceae bacterium]